jgi:hypothetical protein
MAAVWPEGDACTRPLRQVTGRGFKFTLTCCKRVCLIGLAEPYWPTQDCCGSMANCRDPHLRPELATACF